MTHIKGSNRKKKQDRRPKNKMRIDNRNIFILEEIKRKRREQIIRRKRKEKEQSRTGE